MAGKHSNEDYKNTKLRYDLIPPEALEELARVYTIGAVKYGDNDYLNGMEWSRIYAALVRHLQAFWMGESYDPEDGQHHLASVMWCAATLLTYESRNIGEDDRQWLPLLDFDLGDREHPDDLPEQTPHSAFEWLLDAAQRAGVNPQQYGLHTFTK